MYINHFRDENQPKMTIEFTADASVHNPRTYNLVEQAREFFAEVKERTGWDVSVIYREPLQIFHEKTRQLSPQLASADLSSWAGKQLNYAERVRDGRYIVEPAGPVEERYLNALRQAAYEVGEKEMPGQFNQRNIYRPSDIDDTYLQWLQNNTDAFTDRHSRNRQLPGFKAYAAERADAGEVSMAHFLEQRPAPEGNAKRVNFFVSTDHGAIRRVKGVGAGKTNAQVQALRPNEFPAELGKLVQEVRDLYPEARDIPFPALNESFVSRVLQSANIRGIQGRG